MRTIHVVSAFARASLGSNITYRGAIVVWMILSVIRLGVALFIWLAAENTVLGGYTKPEIIGYYLVALFVDWILMWNPFSPILQEIKSGHIMTYLLKPASYAAACFGKEVGFKITATAVIAIAGILLVVSLRLGHIPVSLTPSWRWVALAVAAPGAIAISFLLTLCMAFLGFWFTEARYVNYVYWTFMPLLGGIFLPTSFLPPVVERINWFLPFRYHLSFPMEIMFHRLDTKEAIVSIVIMTCWTAVFYWLYRRMWKAGVKAYSAFGQ